MLAAVKESFYRVLPRVETPSLYHRTCFVHGCQGVSSVSRTIAAWALGDALASVVPGRSVVEAGRLYENLGEES